ncbi:S1C family serine protease [Paenibacillus sp. CAU 1782]
MDDQNNKKGYDDFFSSDGSNRSDNNTSGSDEQSYGENKGYSNGYSYDNGRKPDEATNEGFRNEQPKEAHYYSYGPISGGEQQPQQVPVQQPAYYNQSSGGYNQPPSGYPQQPSQIQPTRTFTPSGKGWGETKEKKRGSSFKSVFLSFMAGVLVVGALMYTADVQNWFTSGRVVETGGGSGQSTQGSTVSQQTGNASAAVAARPDNIAQLFDTASPAVVKIETYAKTQTSSSSGGSSLFDDPFFRQFFGNDAPSTRTPSTGNEGQLQQTGVGTGFFFDSTGYILTNQHVVGDADEIRVTVQGYDKPLTAKLLGNSYDLDLAVIKVEGDTAFPTLPLGSSEDINIGDWVVAIGNPYGFDHTITVGVLSAKERPISISDANGERNYKHLLQTDASINPGNSGGPLLNVKGEVVGINTAVSSQAQGIGFAIPTSTINEVLESLKNNTEIPKEPAPFIGANLMDMTEEYAQQLGLDKAEGSLVTGVYYNSPAYLGDLKQYDVITGVDGKKFTSRDALIAEIQSKKVGDKVQFNVIRKGEAINLEIEIGDKNVFGVQ